MNVGTKERIAKLETLLARVATRAAEPRGAVAAPVAEHAPAVDYAPILDHAPVVDDASVAEEAPISSPPDTSVAMAEDLAEDMEVEVSAEVVEVDIDLDEPTFAESGAHAVGDVSVSAELVDEDGLPEEELVEAPVPTQEEARAEEDITLTAAAANEVVEDEPSSSPRPIAAPTYETEERESAPRHTPPPESGKQVAAPSVQPAARKSSVPPASLEGHTLIGGWREPGLGGHGGLPGMGVRVPPPPPQQRAPSEPAARLPSDRPVAPPVASARPPAPIDLSPEITAPAIATGSTVATFEVGPAPRPTTFGDLLDLTLGL